MNCPKCKKGVMESLGFIPMNGESLFVIEVIHKTEQTSPLGLDIKVCSFDECGYSEMKAAPGTLSEAKRIIRKRLYKNISPDANVRVSHKVKI
jgi:hypothetical protein